jgi:hypothetical protein
MVTRRSGPYEPADRNLVEGPLQRAAETAGAGEWPGVGVGEGGERTVGADGLGDLLQDVFPTVRIEQRPGKATDYCCNP